MRPDYEEWLKENKMEKTEHEWNTKETLLAIGVIALIAHGIPAL